MKKAFLNSGLLILFITFITSSCATSESQFVDYHRTGTINSVFSVEKENDAIFVRSFHNLLEPVIKIEKDLSVNLSNLSTIISTNNLRIVSNHHDFEMVNLFIDYNDDDYLSNQYELFLILSSGRPNKRSRVINKAGVYKVFLFVSHEDGSALDIGEEIFLLMAMLHELKHVEQALEGEFDGLFVNKNKLEFDAYRFAYCYIGNILEGAHIDIKSTRDVIQSDYQNLQRHGVRSISMQQHIKFFDALLDEAKVEKINTETSKEQAMLSLCEG